MSYNKRAYSEVDPDGAGIEPAPYSQVGRVTHNARVDAFSVAERLSLGAHGTYYQQALVEDRMFNIDKPEPVLQRVGRVEEFRTGGRVGFHASVFSSMNALREKKGTQKHKVVEKYRLAGIAQSTVKFHGDRANTDFLSVTTGGTHTLWNTGTERIAAGDEVWWDIPDVGPDGTATGYTPRRDAPRGKIPAVVIKPYRPDVHGPAALPQLIYAQNEPNNALVDRTKLSDAGHLEHMFDCMMRFVALGVGSVNAKREFSLNPQATMDALNDDVLRTQVLEFLINSKDTTDALTPEYNAAYGNLFSNAVNCFAEHINYIGCRKFGKATSNCDPGNPFDIVLGTYRLS